MKSYFVSLFLVISLSLFAINPDVKTAQNFNQSIKWGFEENKGQVTGQDSAKVKFFYKQGNLTMFLLNTGIAYQFEKRHYPEGYKPIDKSTSLEEIEKHKKLSDSIRVETYRMDLELIGANPYAEIIKEDKSSDYIQYYNHNALGVLSYQKITYKNIYPNVDWVVYKTDTGVKYDFVVRPGGDLNNIQMEIKWPERISLNQDGSITLHSRLGDITEKTPISSQQDKEIESRFKLKKNILSFEFTNYDKTQTLIIDPEVAWSTYYGGNLREIGYGCSTDKLANIYLAGFTESNTQISSGGHQISFGGAEDAFLVKFDKTGVRLWSTYYGGSSGEYGHCCAVDRLGNVFLAGYSGSNSNIAFGGHQNIISSGGADAFLVKFNSTGTRLWATYYGGNDFDEALACATDTFGNIYISGNTWSSNNISSGGHQNSMGGIEDAFLVKFNSTGTRLWATYYGGVNADYGYSCVTDYAGNIYLAGSTWSDNNISSNGFQNSKGAPGGIGAYLVKFNSTGTRQWGTFYGGTFSTEGRTCSTDNLGNAFLAGYTSSISSIAAGGHQNSYGGGGYDAYLVKFNSTGVRQWGTYYGGNSNDFGYSCATDDSFNVYLTGASSSINNIALGGYQNSNNGGQDAFIVKLNSAGIRQWATYLGGSVFDEGTSCYTDSLNYVYMAGRTNSNSNIATRGFQNSFGGIQDAFLIKIQSYSFPTITIYKGSNDTICNNRTISFYSHISFGGSAPKYQWFKNGLLVDTNHTYTTNKINEGDSIICKLKSSITGMIIDSAFSNIITMKVLKSDTIVINDTICLGRFRTFNGRNFYFGGVYFDTFLNSKGCDSFVVLKLIVRKNDTTIMFDTICPNKSLLFNSNLLKTTGIYYDTLTSLKGCDSIIELRLSIRKNDSTAIYDTICQNKSYLFNNTMIANPGLYYDTLINRFGCDSFILLNLLQKNSSARVLFDTICSNKGIIFNNLYRNTSGIYLDTLTNNKGCDSFLTLNLFVKQSSVKNLFDSICEGDSVLFKSIWRKNAAIYRDTLTNSVGCDSFINLFLYIKNKTYSIQNIKRCFNDPYFFNGQNLIKDGTYYDTLINSKNCDSIIQLNLTIIPSLIRPDFDTSLKLCYSNASPLLNKLSSNGIIGVWKPSTIDNKKTSSYMFTPDANQCATSTILSVEILPLPIVKLDFILNDTICIGDSVKISILGESNYNYRWSSGESTSYKIASPYENSSYFVTITNSYGCNQIETAKIYVRSLQAKISGPNRVNKGDNVQLNVISNLPVKDYNWLPKEYFKEQKGDQAYIKIEETLTVELNAKDSFGCQALDIFPIKLIGKDILVPTGFSPNKDGVNDYFLPIVKDNVKILAFRVYNRWGEMVYNYDSNYKIGWDGKFNEDDCSVGIYNYHIEYSIESKVYKTSGDISLIR